MLFEALLCTNFVLTVPTVYWCHCVFLISFIISKNRINEITLESKSVFRGLEILLSQVVYTAVPNCFLFVFVYQEISCLK